MRSGSYFKETLETYNCALRNDAKCVLQHPAEVFEFSYDLLTKCQLDEERILHVPLTCIASA